MVKPASHAVSRYYFLDGIRGIAALLVAQLHLTIAARTVVVPHAGFFVDVFFVLSGFVIAANYQHRISAGMSLQSFVWARLVRFYPMYLIALVIGVAAIMIKTRMGLTTYAPIEVGFAAFYNLFYLPYFNIQNIHLLNWDVAGELFPFNGPAWSLFLELAINIVFFINLKTRNVSPVRIAGVAFVAFAVIILLGHGEAGWGSKNWFMALPRVVFGFFAGVAIFEFSRTPRYAEIRSRLQPRAPLWMLAILAYLVTVAAWPLWGDRLVMLIGVTVLPFAIMAATCLETGRTWNAIFFALGYLSYPVYCLHTPVLNALDILCLKYGLGLAGWSYVVTGVIATIGLSLVLAGAYDEPLREWLRGHGKRAKVEHGPAGEALRPRKA